MKKGFTKTKKVIGNWVLNLFLTSLIISMSFEISTAQYSPFHYFTFDGSNPLKDSLSTAVLNPAYFQSTYNFSNSAVGKSLTLGVGGKDIVVSSTMPIDTVITIEYLFKPSHDFSTTTFITRRDGAVYIKMGYPYIEFITNAISSAGAGIHHDQMINLEGIGRASFSYYVDGNFHQMVFKYNVKTGVKEVWIDGQLPNGFSASTTTGRFNPNIGNLSNNILDLSSVTSYDRLNGDVDELALYNIDLPGNMIYKHYTEFLQARHFSFNSTTLNAPTPSAVTAGIDLNDYPVGHPTPSVNAIDQLKSYPTPRYKKGHTLLPNFDWIGMEYFGSAYQPNVTNATAVANTVAIQTELAKNFNYSVLVASNTCSYTQYSSTSNFQGAWVQLANQNPQWKTSAICFWAQINPQVAGYTSNTGYISNKNLSSQFYLKNSSSQFLDLNGNTSSNKYWTPSAPVDSFYKDGLTQRFLMTKLLNVMTRPLDFLCENGEVIPKPELSAMQKDPSVVNDKNTTSYDWDTYLGNRKLKASLAYRDQFITLPGLQNTKYTEYQISGATSRIKYSETRGINKNINGQNYATPDFYPRWASNWYTGVSAWNGWQHIIEGRYYELQLGDKLYSPFVAAGWDLNEENNIRPGQWLGLLKVLGMTGAEFYYTGYFNEAGSYNAPNPPPASPDGYAWQAVMPSYAQATTSRFEDVLRNGSLLLGDAPYSTGTPSRPGYSFNTGDTRKLVVVRKSDTKDLYAITGTIQPNSNMMGNAEIEGDALINLNGQQLQFKVRRQGSTYIYDNTNPSQPIFYQIDAWHESTHPSRWSKDFNIEAEVFDNTTALAQVKTVRSSNANTGDFRNATSYVTRATTATTNPTLEYNFTPRNNSNLYFWVRARNNGGPSAGITVSLNGQNQKSIGCIADTAWNWYSLDACSNAAITFSSLSPQEYTLMITPNGSTLEIDRMLLTIDPTINLNSNQASCGTTVAAISQSGSTNFCQGGSVTLTAALGTGYTWSNGQTVQSITVGVSGNYSVTVNNGTGCSSISNPITVTVQSKPSSIITPSGSTTICNGQNVILSSSLGTSYLWSNSATTQSITVSSTGNYNVTVSNSNGCTSTSAIQTVTVSSAPIATISANGNTSFCQGGSVVLSAPAGYNYLWSNGKTTQQITATSAGNYSVTVTNSSGCSATSSVQSINVSTSPIATITASGNTSFCQGGSVILSAPTGYNYIWSNGNTAQQITATTTGNYSVTVTNSGGCSATSTIQAVTVTNTPIATITANGNTSICQGGSVILSAPFGYNYIWSNGNSTQQITVTTAGNYAVTISNTGGCNATSQPISITVNSLPQPIITANGSLSFCNGGNVQLNVTGATSYVWSNGATTSSITATQSGNYLVTATDANGCNGISNSIPVINNAIPIAAILVNGPTTLVTGQSTTLTASNGVSYLWQPGGMTTPSIIASTAGTYNVIVTNANGCTAQSADIIITQPSLSPNVSIQTNGSPSFCDGGSVHLNVVGGSNNYIWSPGGSTSNNITVTKEGMYYVYSRNNTGQVVGRDSIYVSVNSIPLTPEIRITYIPNTAYQLTAFEPSAVTYLWSNGQTTASVNVMQAQNLSVRTTNAFGCTSPIQQMNVNSIISKSCTTPDMLTAYNLSDTSANLGWNPAITGEIFKVKYWENGSSIIKEISVSGTTSSISLPNLLPGTSYRWYVQSVCTSGIYQSGTYLFKTLSNPLNCGSVPEHLRAINIKTKKADLVWYSTIADIYQVKFHPVGSTTWKFLQLTGPLNSSGTTLSNLLSNTTYEWQIQTTCKGYTSPYSQTSLFTTLDTCGELGTLTLLNINTTIADLGWTNLTPMNSVRIKITDVSTGTYRLISINYNPSNGIYRVTKLQPNRKYTAEVRGICSTGVFGPWSNKITFTTSTIILRLEDNNPLQLNGYPNPTTDRLFYSFTSAKKGDYIVKVCDLSGRELMQEMRSSDEGDNANDIAVNNFAKGIYMLIVQKGTETSRFRFAVE